MTTETLNSLSKASSAYLRSAMHQPIRWHEWGEEAFATAKRENKPILLDIGAVWCHWCHVMDRESYDDPEIAQIVNERFIAVKVDRDERPDIDSRYQVAVSAISGQGGWPLDRLSHSRWQAVLRRHLLPAGRSIMGVPVSSACCCPLPMPIARRMAKSWSRRRWLKSLSRGPNLLPAAAASFLRKVIDAIVQAALKMFDATQWRLRQARPSFLILPRSIC